MNRTSPALAAVCALLGFLLVVSVASADAVRREQAPRKARLIDLIESRREQVEDLDGEVGRLRREVIDAERRATRQTRADREQAEWVAELAAQAGTTELQGRGLEVVLRDSDRQAPSTEEAGAYRIRDSDLQLVVNALFGAEAEAVAVNGNRIVSTTAIRSAGDTIVVNFRPLTPPYEVVGIGADQASFAASDIAGRFRRWSTLFGLGFTVDQVDDATVPAYTGRVAISNAVPASDMENR